jgi:hypothetical protein
MRTAVLRLVVVILASLAARSEVVAAPRLSVGPVRGDRRVIIPTQVATELCASFECVLWAEVSTQRQPDLAKASKARVDGVLVGAISTDTTGASASLSLLTTSLRPARTWTFTLSAGGALRASDLKRLKQDLEGLLRPAAAQKNLPAPRTPRPVEPAPAASIPLPPAPRVAPVTRPSAPDRPQTAEPAMPGPVSVAVELGAFLAQRRLSYGGVTTMTGSLQAFDASSIGGPALRAEVFPAARSRSSVLSGLAVYGRYDASIGLKTVAPSAEERPTSFSRLELGAAWHSPPLGSLQIRLAPRLAYRALTLAVRPSIPGLPDADLAGVTIGLGAEARVASGVTLLAGAGWVEWLTARDLIKGSPSFFPGGRAWGLEAEFGVGVALWGPLSLRVLGEYASTRYTLQADPSGTYGASRAEDRLLGARAMVRGEF